LTSELVVGAGTRGVTRGVSRMSSDPAPQAFLDTSCWS
jgi:hypothetical protein